MASAVLKHAEEWPEQDMRCAQLVNARDKIRASLYGYTWAAKYKACLFMIYELDMEWERRNNG